MGHIAVWILLLEFHYEGPISLKFTYLPQSGAEFNFLLLKGINLTNYIWNYSQIEVKEEQRILKIAGKNYQNACQ